MARKHVSTHDLQVLNVFKKYIDLDPSMIKSLAACKQISLFTGRHFKKKINHIFLKRREHVTQLSAYKNIMYIF